MEATNISIKQQISVSINIETLQAIKQRVLSAVAKLSIFNFQFSIWRIYRHQLRLARAVARVIDAHPTISNIALWIQAFVGIYLIFMYA